MTGIKFEKVNESIYLLRTPYEDTAVGITLALGKSTADTVLIDTGANAAAIDTYLVPALNSLGITPSDIGTVALTHCHTDNIGGLKRLTELAPHIKLAATELNLDRLRNPMRYLIERRRLFPEDEHPFEELSGVISDILISEADPLPLPGFKLINAAGHTPESVCYYHEKSRTLISGDAFQGNGNASQGLASLEDCGAYIRTLDRFKPHTGTASEITNASELDIKYLVCSHDTDGMEFYERLGSVSDAEGSGDEAKTRNIVEIAEKCKEVVLRYSEQLDKLLASTASIVDLTSRLLDEYGKQRVRYPIDSMLTVKSLLSLKNVR